MPIATKNQIAHCGLKRNTCKAIILKKEKMLNVKNDDEYNDSDCPKGGRCPFQN